MGQIGPKWDKSGTFSHSISVHFGAGYGKGDDNFIFCENITYALKEKKREAKTQQNKCLFFC